MNLRKLFLVTTTILGSGLVLVNVAVAILLGYFISLLTISSLTQVMRICGTILFLLASVAMIILGFFVIVGGLYSYRWGPPEGIISLGVFAGSFYLLCLGIGSALLEIGLEGFLLISSAVLFMLGVAAYLSSSVDFKLIGSIMGIIGGILLATAIFNLRIFGQVFVGWDVAFTGPFMSMNILEEIVVILGPVAVLGNLILTARKQRSVSHVFFPIITLIYGIGLFIGSLTLAFSLWDQLWKSPWLPPLHGVPNWVFIATVFWSVSLVILAIGGILLVTTSSLTFASIAKEASVTSETSQTLPYGTIQYRLHKERSRTT